MREGGWGLTIEGVFHVEVEERSVAGLPKDELDSSSALHDRGQRRWDEIRDVVRQLGVAWFW